MPGRTILTYVGTAIASALYWGIAGWVCNAATEHDPVDLATGGGAGHGSTVTITLVLTVFIVGYALAIRGIKANRADD